MKQQIDIEPITIDEWIAAINTVDRTKITVKNSEFDEQNTLNEAIGKCHYDVAASNMMYTSSMSILADHISKGLKVGYSAYFGIAYGLASALIRMFVICAHVGLKLDDVANATFGTADIDLVTDKIASKLPKVDCEDAQSITNVYLSQHQLLCDCLPYKDNLQECRALWNVIMGLMAEIHIFGRRVSDMLSAVFEEYGIQINKEDSSNE